jgi:hypothetical protein
MKKVCLIFLIIPYSLVLLTGCSKGGGNLIDPSPAQAPTLTVTATPDTLWYSGTSTINWSSTNATSVSMAGGSISGTSGSFTTPALTSPTTYSITATGQGGSTTKAITIKVWSERMTLWCHYGPFTGYLFRVCREDSINFASAWRDLPSLIDHNSLQFFPNGSGQINGGLIYPNVWSFQNNETIFFDGLQHWTIDSLNTSRWIAHKVEPDGNPSYPYIWRTVIGYKH